MCIWRGTLQATAMSCKLLTASVSDEEAGNTCTVPGAGEVQAAPGDTLNTQLAVGKQISIKPVRPRVRVHV